MNLQEESRETVFTPFWPICMIAVSMAVFLSWQVISGARQYINLLRLADQQNALSGQAVQAESKLQAMMMDLLNLSKTDTDARTVVTKYGIKYNPAQQSSASPVETLLTPSKPISKKVTGAALNPPAKEPRAAE